MSTSIRVSALGAAIRRPGMTGAFAFALVLGFLPVSAHVALAGDLVVTHIAPYSGSMAAQARAYGAGARLYFDRVNAAGGIGGRRIALDARDDAGDPATTARQATAAMASRPLAFIGTIGQESALGLLPMLKQHQTALVGPLVDAVGVEATAGAFVFHMHPDVAQEVEGLAASLHAFGLRKLALCDPEGERYANDTGGTFYRVAARDLVPVRCDTRSGSIDVVVRGIAALEPQAVIFAGSTSAAAELIKALRASGSYAMVVSTSSVDPRELVTMLPRSAAIWLGVAQSIPNPRPVTPSQAEAIVREYSGALHALDPVQPPPTRAGLAGYMAAKMVVEAIRRAGGAAEAPQVARALSTLHDHDLGGIRFDFSGTRAGGTTYTRVGIITATGAVLN